MKPANDRIALIVTLFILIALPLSLYAYHRVYLPHKFRGARIINLTALATDGVWTEEPVRGTNYWRKHFAAAPEIEIKVGEPAVLRLASADVLHSFAIPLLNIGPIDVPAGEVREIAFTPQRPDTLVFLCWQVCSPVHGKLRGKIIVLGPDGKPTASAPNLDGQPHEHQRMPKAAAAEPDLN